YANQSTSGGIVDEFSTNGTFIKTLINDTAGTNLSAPWGLAIAPAGWGKFGGDLLVGNNNANSAGLTEINAYNLTTGLWQGTLTLDTGQPFSATELWALSFGNGGSAGSTDTLFFTAGLDNNTNGLLGAISSVPEPSSAVLGLIALGVLAGGWRWKNRRRSARS
ncbi:MAG: TIGR03118 family protein, partial [Isosphaeraceae bacterium]